MIDLGLLIDQRRAAGDFDRIVNNGTRQFGRGPRVYLGAELMPEQLSRSRLFRDTSVRYRRLIAVDADRYSPVELRNGLLTGSVLVELMDNSTGSTMTAEEMDALNEAADLDNEAAALAQVTDWADETLALPLAEKNELYRWQCITDAVVRRRGSNGFREDVPFPNPPGVRTAAGGPWSDPNYDPFLDILAHKTRMAPLVGNVVRIVTSTRVLNILLANPKMQLRLGAAVVQGSAVVPVNVGATPDQLNRYLAVNGLPPIEVYDLTYDTNSGAQPFLRTDAFVMVGASGRTRNVPVQGDRFESLANTIGYIAVGPVAGMRAPGRKVLVAYREEHPIGVYGEAVQCSGPVLTEPDGLGVITGIN